MRWYWVSTTTAGPRPARTVTAFRAPALFPIALVVGYAIGYRRHRQTTTQPLARISVERE